jgi:hypothetical protein
MPITSSPPRVERGERGPEWHQRVLARFAKVLLVESCHPLRAVSRACRYRNTLSIAHVRTRRTTRAAPRKSGNYPAIAACTALTRIGRHAGTDLA